MNIEFVWRDISSIRMLNPKKIVPNALWVIIGNNNPEKKPTVQDLESKVVGLDQRYFLASWHLDEDDQIIKFNDFSKGGNWYLIHY